MSHNAQDAEKAAATSHGSNSDEALGAYKGDIGDYMSNVNSAIAAGNPFKSRDYLTSQNVATSGAMNSANDAARQAEQQVVARTGTNTAALAGEVGSQARAGQRDLTAYNATRDTENESRWLSQRDQLFHDQLEGANSEAGVMGTQLGAQTNNLKAWSDDEASRNAMWAQLGSAALSGGASVGSAFA
jgi:hypothetical protein